MITKLTKKQEKFLVEYRKEMLRYGRSTEPSDRKTTEKSISFLYKKMNKKEPNFFWFDSPFSGTIGIEILKDKKFQKIIKNFGSNLWSNLESNLGSNLRSDLDNMFWGQHELSWVAFYDFCNLIGIKYKKDEREILNHWLNIGKSTGWWSPFENICFCFDRPNVLNLDEDGKLHCLTGPAMAFKDGYSLFFYHGSEISGIDMDIGEVETQIKTILIFKENAA